MFLSPGLIYWAGLPGADRGAKGRATPRDGAIGRASAAFLGGRRSGQPVGESNPRIVSLKLVV